MKLWTNYFSRFLKCFVLINNISEIDISSLFVRGSDWIVAKLARDLLEEFFFALNINYKILYTVYFRSGTLHVHDVGLKGPAFNSVAGGQVVLTAESCSEWREAELDRVMFQVGVGLIGPSHNPNPWALYPYALVRWLRIPN